MRITIQLSSVLLLFFLLIPTGLLAQSEEKILTNSDIISMVKAGLGEDAIITLIKTTKNNFDMSYDALIELRNNGITAKIAIAMAEAALHGSDSQHVEQQLRTAMARGTAPPTYEVLVDKTIILGARHYGGNTRTWINFNLPDNTESWTFWIGVGQSAKDSLDTLKQNLPSKAIEIAVKDPVIAYAIGLIPELEKLSGGLDVWYGFVTSYEDAQAFIAGQSFHPATWLPAGQVVSDYAKISRASDRSIYLILDNSYSLVKQKQVTIKVVAVKR